MGVETLISVEEYRRSSYSPDRHFVDGHLMEREVGEKEHGRMQRALIRFFERYRTAGLEAWPEQRVQISPERYRVVDLCVTEGEPAEQIFTAPPLICFEILSRRDSLHDLQEVIDDYAGMGVPYRWIINPWKRVGYVGSAHGFEKLVDGIFRTSGPHAEVVVPLDGL